MVIGNEPLIVESELGLLVEVIRPSFDHVRRGCVDVDPVAFGVVFDVVGLELILIKGLEHGHKLGLNLPTTRNIQESVSKAGVLRVESGDDLFNGVPSSRREVEPDHLLPNQFLINVHEPAGPIGMRILVDRDLANSQSKRLPPV